MSNMKLFAAFFLVVLVNVFAAEATEGHTQCGKPSKHYSDKECTGDKCKTICVDSECNTACVEVEGFAIGQCFSSECRCSGVPSKVYNGKSLDDGCDGERCVAACLEEEFTDGKCHEKKKTCLCTKLTAVDSTKFEGECTADEKCAHYCMHSDNAVRGGQCEGKHCHCNKYC